MDRLNQLSSYFNEKERRRLDNIAQQNPNGLPEMTFDEIKLSCLENSGYETPELNDKLYLHFRGFKTIENLDRFTGCKALWLDSNGFNKIENLSCLSHLRCLYLSKNLITKIEGLDTLQNLTILDLSNNRLSCIENLSNCVSLQTLNVSHNALHTMESIEHLKQCLNLTTIDLTNNHIEANELFFDIIADIPSLSTLSVNGNEVTKLPTFRKKLIVRNPKLGYIDRPVDEQERFFANAYLTGGSDAELIAREQWKKMQEEKRLTQQQEFRTWQAEQQRLRDAIKAEGKSLITEFTEEERTTRAIEAQAAADAEKRMLDIGIDKIASRYWQIENSSINAGLDPLDEAISQLVTEKDKKNTTSQDMNITDINEIDVEVVLSEDMLNTKAMAIKLNDDDDAPITRSNITNEEQVVISTTAGEDITIVGVEETKQYDSTDTSATTTITKEEQEAIKAAKLLEQKEEEIRQERVAESFYIYKKQLEAEKAGLPYTSNNNLVIPRSNTWENNIMNSSSTGYNIANTELQVEDDDDNDRPLYWSETMDMELAKLVKSCVFDFDEISIEMQELAKKKQLSYLIVHHKPYLLTSEACRLRWASLDANQWSTLAPNSSALDTQFKICIPNAILGTGHGAQPSYSALASMTAGLPPTYLKIPTQFPSTKDKFTAATGVDEDSDMDLD